MSSNQVVWRAKRQPSETADTDLFDVRPVKDSVNRFAKETIAVFDDSAGDKFATYARGQRVEFEHSTDGGSTWTRRFAGFVQEPRDVTEGGVDIFEAAIVGYDHLLRRREVYKTYSSQTISAILEDLITTFTAVNWVAGNVTVQNDATISIEFKGERVDQAIAYLASQSADEDHGVNADFEFFFEQRETQPAPSDIVDGDWLDYDLPEKGKRALNRVKVFYGSGGSESFVTVEDREKQKELRDKLDAPRRVVISTSKTFPEIDNEDAARAKGRQILNDRSSAQTGTVTTFGRFGMESGDVFRLQISEKGIDASFRVAQIEYYWQRDETIVTVAENIGEVDELLVNLADELSRVSARDADPTATGLDTHQFRSGIGVTTTAQVRSRTLASDATVAGYERSVEAGYERGTVAGYRFSSEDFATVSTKKPTTASLNMLRDVWQGESATTVTHLAFGSGTTDATAADTSLDTEIHRVALDKFGETGRNGIEMQTDAIPAGGAFGDAADITEIGPFDASSGGNMYARALFDAFAHGTDTLVSATLTFALGDHTDEQGVIASTGQERARDLFLGDTGHEPATMLYGTGTTAPAEADQSLETQVHSDAIDSTADRAVGISDIVERIGSGEANGNDLTEIGYENSGSEFLARLVFGAYPKTMSAAAEFNYKFRAGILSGIGIEPAVPDNEDLHAHYDASDKTDLSSGWPTEVGPDLSSVGSPSVETDAKNGLNAASYDGVDDGHFSTFSSSLSQPNHIFIAFKLNENNSGNYLIGATSSTARHLFRDINSNWQLNAGSNLEGGSPDQNWHIASVLVNGASSEIRIDGTQVASGNAGSQSWAGISLGYRNYNNDSFLDSLVGEALVYPQDKSARVSAIESYLADRWGIPL